MALAAVPAASAAAPAPLPDGYVRLSGPLDVGLVAPPATVPCDTRVAIGARITADARHAGVEAVRAFRIDAGAARPFRRNRVFRPRTSAWEDGTLAARCGDFRIKYVISVRRYGRVTHRERVFGVTGITAA